MNHSWVDEALDRYLNDIAKRLAGLRREQRDEVLDGLREHMADLSAAGASPDEILAQLGSPASVADAAAVELADRRRFWDAKRWVQLVSILAAFSGSWMVLFATVREEVVESTDGTSGSITFYRVGDLLGWPTALVLAAAPLVLTIVPLVVSGRTRQTALVLGTALLAVTAFVSGLTIATFLSVALIVAITACILPPRS
jgi:uncharacterized membrane protein